MVQTAIATFLNKGGKKDYAWNAGDPIGYLLLLPCPVVKVNVKLQVSSSGMTKRTDPSGIKLWVTLPRKELRLAKLVSEVGRNTEGVVEEKSYKYQIMSCDRL